MGARIGAGHDGAVLADKLISAGTQYKFKVGAGQRRVLRLVGVKCQPESRRLKRQAAQVYAALGMKDIAL